MERKMQSKTSFSDFFFNNFAYFISADTEVCKANDWYRYYTVCVCVCVCVCVYIYIHTHIHIYIYTQYIYTHTHTHSCPSILLNIQYIRKCLK